jgi:hypothetical protein
VVKNLYEVSPLCGLMNIPAKITLTFIKDFANSALIRLEKILTLKKIFLDPCMLSLFINASLHSIFDTRFYILPN